MKNLCLLLFLGTNLFLSQEKVYDLSEHPQQIILPKILKENSGLEYVNGFIYTFNDSGGAAEIYKINPVDGKIVQTLILKKVKNIDFEDITFDGKNLYIADFGNNLGHRKDLNIYYFNLLKIPAQEKVVKVSTKKIKFYIEGQPEEKQEPLTTNFDLEAIVFHNKQLHIFTKEWSNNQTTHYTLETYYTYQEAKKVETFNTQCVVTAADLAEDTLYLTGYTKEGKVFVWKFSEFYENKFFNGKKEKTLIGLSPAIGQIEGLTISNDNIFISGENFSRFDFNCPQKLYTITIDTL